MYITTSVMRAATCTQASSKPKSTTPHHTHSIRKLLCCAQQQRLECCRPRFAGTGEALCLPAGSAALGRLIGELHLGMLQESWPEQNGWLPGHANGSYVPSLPAGPAFPHPAFFCTKQPQNPFKVAKPWKTDAMHHNQLALLVPKNVVMTSNSMICPRYTPKAAQNGPKSVQ